MLDSRAEQMQQPQLVLKGQRIIVLGAACGFGRSFVRALLAAGAQVVAADEDANAVSRFKRAVPLTLNGPPEEALRRVGRAWGEARLDGVLNLMPLRHPEKLDLNVAVLEGIVQGFMPALSNREGQIVSVVARPAQPLDLAAGAMAPAVLCAQAALAHALRHDGITLNLVNVGEGELSPARTAVVGLLANTLGKLTGTEIRL